MKAFDSHTADNVLLWLQGKERQRESSQLGNVWKFCFKFPEFLAGG
jgi:hypothetical protein